MVRRESAKLLFVGSIPTRTYFYKIETAKSGFCFGKLGEEQHQLLGVASGIWVDKVFWLLFAFRRFWKVRRGKKVQTM